MDAECEWSFFLPYFHSAISIQVIEVYGLTEMGGILSATLLGEMEPGRTGTPHLGLQVKLIDVPEMNLYVKRDGLGEVSRVRKLGLSLIGALFLEHGLYVRSL